VKRIVGIDPSWAYNCTGFHWTPSSSSTACRIRRGLSGVTAFFAKIGIPVPGRHGPFVATLELVVVSCSSCLAYALDKSPLRHRDARHDLWSDAYTWMERERSGSGPAGVEPTPRAVAGSGGRASTRSGSRIGSTQQGPIQNRSRSIHV